MKRLPFLAFALFLPLAACSSQSVSEYSLHAELEAELRGPDPLVTQQDYAAYLGRIRAAMDVAVGEGRASRAAQCAVLAYGQKPCGGPSGARVYSTVDGAPDRLRALAALYTEVEGEMNLRFGLVSDCALRPLPTPVLIDGRCVPEIPVARR